MWSPFSRVWLFVMLWTVAFQAPLSTWFPRQEYWSGLPFASLADLPNQEMEPESLKSLALARGFFTTSATWEALLLTWSEVNLTQLCPTLCNPMGYAVYGILQARILEWVAFPFSRGSSQPRDQTQVSCIAGGFFTSWATREAQEYWSG